MTSVETTIDRARLRVLIDRARLMLCIMHHFQRHRFANHLTFRCEKEIHVQRVVFYMKKKQADNLVYLLRERTEVHIALAIADIFARGRGDVDWVTEELIDTLMRTFLAFHDDAVVQNQHEAVPPGWWRRGVSDRDRLWRGKHALIVGDIHNGINALYNHLLEQGVQMVRMHPIAMRFWCLGDVNQMRALLFNGNLKRLTVDDRSCLGRYIAHRDLASVRVLLEFPLTLIEFPPVAEQPWYIETGRDAFLVCFETGWYEGAQLFFDLFEMHRPFFISQVILHVLRYPTPRYACMAGFLHHRRAAFAEPLASSVPDYKHSAVYAKRMVFCMHAGDVAGVNTCWHEADWFETQTRMGLARECCLTWMTERAKIVKSEGNRTVSLLFNANQAACLATVLELSDDDVAAKDILRYGYHGEDANGVAYENSTDAILASKAALVRAILTHRNEALFNRLLPRSDVDAVLFYPANIVEFARLAAAGSAWFQQLFRQRMVASVKKLGSVHRIELSCMLFHLIARETYEVAGFLLSLLEVGREKAELATYFREVRGLHLIDIYPDVLLLLRNTFGDIAMRHHAVASFAMSIPQMRFLFGDTDAAELWRAMHADGLSNVLVKWWVQHESMDDLALIRDLMRAVLSALATEVRVVEFFDFIFRNPLANPAVLDVLRSLLSDTQMRNDNSSVLEDIHVPDSHVLAISIWLARYTSEVCSGTCIHILFRGIESVEWMYASVDVVAQMEAFLEYTPATTMLTALFIGDGMHAIIHELARAMLARGTAHQKYSALFLMISRGFLQVPHSLFRRLATQPDVYPMLCEQNIHFVYRTDTTTTLFEYVLDNSPGGSNSVLSLLLSLPNIRQQAAQLSASQTPASGGSISRQLVELDTSRESSMRPFSPKERAVLEHMRAVYGDTITVLGVPAILADLQRTLRESYEADPAVYRGKPLPFTYALLHRMCCGRAPEHGPTPETSVILEHAKAAYHDNVWHTAARWFMIPNPWIHPQASWVQVDEHDRTKRWASGVDNEKIRYLVALYWLAATDTSVSMIDGATVRDNILLFARTLAMTNRGHNYDRKTRTRKLPGGRVAEDEIDDGEGDRPSCSSGLEQRFFTSVPANPHAHYNDVEDRLRSAIASRLLDKVRLLSIEDRATLIDAMQTYIIDQTLDDEQTFLLMTYNLSEEEQTACMREAGAGAEVAAPFFATSDECLHSHVMQYIPTFYYNANV